MFCEVNNIFIRFSIQKSQNCRVLAVPKNDFYSFRLLFHLQWRQSSLGDWVSRAQDEELCILCTKQKPHSCRLPSHQRPAIFRATFFYFLATNCQAFKKYLIWSTHFIGVQSGARKSCEIYVFKAIQLIHRFPVLNDLLIPSVWPEGIYIHDCFQWPWCYNEHSIANTPVWRIFLSGMICESWKCKHISGFIGQWTKQICQVYTWGN